MEYVCGFMIATHGLLSYRQSMGHVLLIEKRRPDFQCGLWNGVGGKVEPGEHIWDAMVREFREETGVVTSRMDWIHTIVFTSTHGYIVNYFACFVDELPAYCTTTDEVVRAHHIRDVPLLPQLDNMRWIFPMQFASIEFPVSIQSE